METKKEEEVNLAQMICDREISEKERKTMRGSWSVKQGNIAMVKLNGLLWDVSSIFASLPAQLGER